MKSVTIGYTREDGDFAILATMNNKDGLMSDDVFKSLVRLVRLRLSVNVDDGTIQVLEREDAPDYLDKKFNTSR